MRTAVALSGGMDSLAALVLLKQQGREVGAMHGFFLPPDETARKTADELGNLCASLKIPFHTVDLSRSFQEYVIRPFVREYLAGRTPNPCVVCNRAVKFNLLRQHCQDMGYEVLATGHYARLTTISTDRPSLFRGADPNKDQSYFLSMVRSDDLASALLPLGTWTKKEVGAMLKKLEYTPVHRKESQEVCFIPGNDYRAFLKSKVVGLPGPGPVKTRTGKVLGKHLGLWRYTLGQRRGLGIPFSEPLYVLDKDLEDNALIVGVRDEFLSPGCTVDDVNLLVPYAGWPEELLVQTVYRQKPKPARIYEHGSSLEIVFESSQPKPCPGQVAAVYTPRGQVLAGGVIRHSK